MFDGVKALCSDCSKETLRTDFYMVRDVIWSAHGSGRGFLCIACLEKRMGRALVRSDFVAVLLNTLSFQSDASELLLDRLRPTHDLDGLTAKQR